MSAAGSQAATGDPAADDVGRFVVDELERYQRLSLEVLEASAGRPGDALRGLVALHLAWTEEDPERARTVGRHRNEAISGPHGPRLIESNRDWFGRMKDWIDAEAAAGVIEPVSFNLLHAVVFAPTQEIAKLWLAGRLKRPLSEYAGPLGDAAVAAVGALPPRGGSVPGAGPVAPG
jgi:hypothetical protein